MEDITKKSHKEAHKCLRRANRILEEEWNDGYDPRDYRRNSRRIDQLIDNAISYLRNGKL